MRYSKKFNILKYSEQDKEKFNKMINDFPFDMEQCLVSDTDIYYLKTGRRTGLLKDVSKDIIKNWLPFKLKEGKGSLDGVFRGRNGFVIEKQVFDELWNSLKYERKVRITKQQHYTIKITLPSYKRDKDDCLRTMFIDVSTGTIDFKNNIVGVLFTSNEYF